MLAVLLVCAVVAFGLVACQSKARPRENPSENAPVVLFFGNSITSGPGLDPGQAFPALIQERINREGLDYRCVNAGVGGQTTTGALGHLDQALARRPAVVVVELGINDAFRSMGRARTARNLKRIIEAFAGSGSRVILAAVLLEHIHPALGPPLGEVYRAVAEKTGALLVPDLMAGVAGVRLLSLADGLHPNAQGHKILAASLWPVLEKELQALRLDSSTSTAGKRYMVEK
ncbi:MAG: GDSL-type esterase/lipase family protein [Deltaproteobacteria bacterium]